MGRRNGRRRGRTRAQAASPEDRGRSRGARRNSASRQRPALLALSSALRCANANGEGEDPRALLNARELEALDADTKGYSFIGP